MGKSNNKLKGEEFEKEVLKSLPGSQFKYSCNSGAKNDDADIRSAKYLIECKVKNTDNFKHSNKEMRKLIKQADKLGKDWLYILKNNKNEKFVLTSLDNLVDLLETIEYLKSELNNSERNATISLAKHLEDKK